jgi:type IX secretion system PorP/SprF family membrane protein
MRVFFCSILFFNTLYFTSAQSPAGLPAQFIQFFKTYNLINPAAMGRDSSFEVNTGSRSLLGDFSGIRTIYVIGHIQLGNTPANKVRNRIGINFINDREGSYISRNRASVMYAVHIPLSTRAALNAGANIGFINYSYKPSDFDGGGSDFAPNADIGLWYQRLNFNFGISANQLIPSQLTPTSQTYFIERYYNLNIDKTFNLSHHFSLKPALGVRLLNKNTFNIDAALMALIQNNLLVGVTYKYRRGASLTAGLENLSFGQNVFKFLFSYYSSISGLDYYNPQSVELSLCWLHKKRIENQPDEEY